MTGLDIMANSIIFAFLTFFLISTTVAVGCYAVERMLREDKNKNNKEKKDEK